MPVHRLQVVIDIAYDDFLPYYEGHINDVVAPDLTGKQVRFPANALRPFLTHTGVNGIFELQISEDNKLQSCQRIGNIPN